MVPASEDQPKPVRWIGSSKEDLRSFPKEVRGVGVALWQAQIGSKADYAKPLKNFGDARVLEIVDDFDGSTFRAVYTGALPRLSMFCTPSRRSPSAASPPPKAELDLINRRLKRAKEDYEQWSKSEKPKSR